LPDSVNSENRCLLLVDSPSPRRIRVTDGDNITEKKGHGPGVAFADYDGDGFTDIYVANDGMQQHLLHITMTALSAK